MSSGNPAADKSELNEDEVPTPLLLMLMMGVIDGDGRRWMIMDGAAER